MEIQLFVIDISIYLKFILDNPYLELYHLQLSDLHEECLEIAII